MIAETAREMGIQKWTTAEVDQLRRKLQAEHGEAGKTSNDYIVEVLKAVGLKMQLTEREEAEERFEEEFDDILHFKTLQDAEVSLTRLDELLRRFKDHEEPAAAQRVLEIARLGKRRAEMIARNRKVEAKSAKRKRKSREWFRIWLETPDAFFNWLDVRKASPAFQRTVWRARRGGGVAVEAEPEKKAPGTASVHSGRAGHGPWVPARKAVGMELLETESREPVHGNEAALIWGAALPALAAKEQLVVDFFSHLERVREFCKLQGCHFAKPPIAAWS